MSATLTGPLFDSRGEAIVRRHAQDMENAGADEALRRVHQRLGRVLRHPTGYYQSRVVKTMRSGGAEVDDSRVVYGPWLEGVSSRNDRSRFKGYHTFQLVGQSIETDIPMLVAPATTQMVKELS